MSWKVVDFLLNVTFGVFLSTDFIWVQWEESQRSQFARVQAQLELEHSDCVQSERVLWLGAQSEGEISA